MPTQPRLIAEEPAAYDASHDVVERAASRERLREKLQDPEFRQIEGFPIGDDEAILALSDPPYYTACPNPFLPEIIARWQEERRALRAELGLPDDLFAKFRESDSAANGYSREPFAADVSEGKNDPIYNAHSYHTKVPHKAIMRYILHYTDPGDIVFDGFCGTGMTGVAAQLCGDKKAVESLGYRVDGQGIVYDGDQPISRLGDRKAVLVDLSPAATFIAYNYNTPVDVAAFEREAKRILREVEEECGWMYETWHPHCDDPRRVKGKINYTVWSDVFVCLNCAGELVFWDVAIDHATGGVQDSFLCPHCGAEQSKRGLDRVVETVFDRALGELSKRAKQAPALINCTVGKNRRGKRPDRHDLELIEKIQGQEIPYLFPHDRIDRDIDMWYERDYRSLGLYSLDGFFTQRNLYTLALTWQLINEAPERVRRQLQFVFSGTLQITSRMSSFRYDSRNPNNTAGGILKGALYIPSLSKEGRVADLLDRRLGFISRMLRARAYTIPGAIVISTASSSRSDIPDNSIDYIFTDPPFGSNIIYSDLSLPWESWLGITTDTESEAVVHRRKKVRPSTLQTYQSIMVECFQDFYRILRSGRWLTVEFHNTQNAVWNAIQEAIARAGFVIADVRTLDKGSGTFKQVNTTAAVKQDLIITAYKPAVVFENRFQPQAGSEAGAWTFIDEHLRHLPLPQLRDSRLEMLAERQAYLLFDRMVAFHIQRGLTVPLSAAEFYAGLKERYSERDGMYFLPPQAAEYDKLRLQAQEVQQFPLIVTDEKTAILWLRQQLEAQPQTFQEIQPKFLRELHQLRHEKLAELRDLLEESFLEDAAGRWYVPDPNRAQDLEKLRERALLREFATYVEGRGRLKVFRSEAVRAGFGDAWRRRDYATIVKVAERLPERVLQEDQDLLMYYDNALNRVER
ncbi:MAG TPA: DNA methylase [Chloroflexi bacterium]|nr:DNA methylase [Chloroflexota bacterium]